MKLCSQSDCLRFLAPGLTGCLHTLILEPGWLSATFMLQTGFLWPGFIRIRELPDTEVWLTNKMRKIAIAVDLYLRLGVNTIY